MAKTRFLRCDTVFELNETFLWFYVILQVRLNQPAYFFLFLLECVYYYCLDVLEFNVEEHSFNLRTSSTVRIKCALEKIRVVSDNWILQIQ